MQHKAEEFSCLTQTLHVFIKVRWTLLGLKPKTVGCVVAATSAGPAPPLSFAAWARSVDAGVSFPLSDVTLSSQAIGARLPYRSGMFGQPNINTLLPHHHSQWILCRKSLRPLLGSDLPLCRHPQPAVAY